ncbi:interactor of constitutive active ROPs 2, chloroplastic-like [Dorcoceras hygrometricum]|uniref:Interactor of constitutive active ROPs 2, chloroplastic-like n=1 Tax=Dorcoceras hygrometricum TaxID=472368 RepID=A0A2Z6ZW06_9LAMI|nr:interactor of constitutive active ROPs 2, chloroplastic-like [Dorcoceras hygrometricum]
MRRRARDQQKKRSAKRKATSYGEASSRKSLFISRKLQYNQQMLLEIAIAKRCRLHKLIRQRFALAIKIQQEDFALIVQQTKLQCPVATQRYPDAIDEPVASNSSIQSRAFIVSAVATQPVASFAYSVDLVPRRKN